jgi:hypothetical protein
MHRIQSLFATLWNITIEEGLVKAARGVFETIDAKSGVTTYDEDTGQPYCMKVKSGQTVTVPGKCGEVSNQVSVSPTPELTPDPTPSPESTPTPEATAVPSESPSPTPEAVE